MTPEKLALLHEHYRDTCGGMDQGTSDNVARLTADRDRVRGEVENLVRSIAAGVPADTVAPSIRERELEIARLEVRLRTPRQQPNIERLRDALTQRAAEWRVTLRSEPKVARLLLRRLIGPLVLYDESTRPDFIKADAVVKTGLIDGLAEIQDVASPPGFEPGPAAEKRTIGTIDRVSQRHGGQPSKIDAIFTNRQVGGFDRYEIVIQARRGQDERKTRPCRRNDLDSAGSSRGVRSTRSSHGEEPK